MKYSMIKEQNKALTETIDDDATDASANCTRGVKDGTVCVTAKPQDWTPVGAGGVWVCEIGQYWNGEFVLPCCWT